MYVGNACVAGSTTTKPHLKVTYKERVSIHDDCKYKSKEPLRRLASSHDPNTCTERRTVAGHTERTGRKPKHSMFVDAWQTKCSPPTPSSRPWRETPQQLREESMVRAALLRRIERRRQAEQIFVQSAEQMDYLSLKTIPHKTENLEAARQRRRREEALSIAKVREISKQCPECRKWMGVVIRSVQCICMSPAMTA